MDSTPSNRKSTAKPTALELAHKLKRRRYDRESDYADIYISHILPPNIDLDIKIIDRLCRYIEPQLEYFEEQLVNLNIDDWGNELHDALWAKDVAEAELVSVNWMLRQQAALAENQMQFAKQANQFKADKLKNK